MSDDSNMQFLRSNWFDGLEFVWQGKGVVLDDGADSGYEILVDGELVDYDEGNVHRETIVYKSTEDKYYSVLVSSNSWADCYDDSDDIVIKEVKPHKETITVYKVVETETK